MNKIIALIVLSLVTANLQAQQLKSQVPANAKVMTAQEANALNGKAEPTINGIPYSQYKAQQEALKTQQSKPVVNPATNGRPAPNEEARQVSPATKPVTAEKRN